MRKPMSCESGWWPLGRNEEDEDGIGVRKLVSGCHGILAHHIVGVWWMGVSDNWCSLIIIIKNGYLAMEHMEEEEWQGMGKQGCPKWVCG